MNQKQWKRLDVLERIRAGKLTRAEAATVLGLSTRQVRRLERGFEARGRAVVVHGNVGRTPSNQLKKGVRAKVLKLWQQKYHGFNDTHFTEKLGSDEGVEVSRQTVRRWLREAGERAARPRRAKRHRRRRERKPQAGQMLLWDGSRHAWLEERGPMLCLIGAVDDATGELLPGAHFVEQECAAGYLRVLRDLIAAKGIPMSLYMDKHGSLRRNDNYWSLEEELRGEQDPTQVGRALRALEIEVIFANSPQAKGRVERAWETLQDRLVSELRLAGVRTAQQANEALKTLLPKHNRRFARAPAEAEPAWRRVRAGVDLDRICSFFHEAIVGNDNAIRLSKVVIDIPPGPGGRGYAQARVEVRQLLDGSWRVYLGDQCIADAASTATQELRAPRSRKRSAASKAFRRAVHQVAATLP